MDRRTDDCVGVIFSEPLQLPGTAEQESLIVGGGKAQEGADLRLPHHCSAFFAETGWDLSTNCVVQTFNTGSLHCTDHRFAMICSGRDDRMIR